MKTELLTPAEQYVRKVMGLIHAPAEEAARIESDLREHLREGIRGGEGLSDVIERMGDPREIAAEFMAQLPVEYASFWRRLAAFLVDMVLLTAIAATGAGFTIAASNAVPQHPETLLENVWGGAVILSLLVIGNSAIAILIAYFPLLEARFGQSLGKRLFGIRVRSDDGLPASAWQAILRRLSFYFSIFPIDALFVFFTARRQRGFDILARTVVVRD